MYKLYFKQAWNMIRQERLFSLIYIIGTGVSVSMVMVLSIVFYIRMANIYPETNRDRMLVVKSGTVTKKENNYQSSSALSEPVIQICLGSLDGIEAIGLIYRGEWGSSIQPEGKQDQIPVTVQYVNTGYWKVFPFLFRSGQPFTEADQQSAIRKVVIAESMSHRLFGSTETVGKYISLNFRSYQICGVVKDASLASETTFAQLWIPYTVCSEYHPASSFDPTGSLGNFQAYLLSAPGADMKKLKTSIQENVRRYSQTLSNATFSILGQPDYHWQSTFRLWANDTPDFAAILLQNGCIFFILLLIPAVSLSGMTESRMERRLAEMGVRRAFGAPVGKLLKQIVSENFLYTLLGGAFGLILSYLLVYLTKDWIMQINMDFISIAPEGVEMVIAPDMLINYQVFGIALLVCLLLNLLSSLVPAWRASHREIVYSLNAK